MVLKSVSGRHHRLALIEYPEYGICPTATGRGHSACSGVDPFFPYSYPYPPGYVTRNYGYVKVKTHGREASVYVDGGYAVKTKKNKEFALRPGNHDIELRDQDGRTFFSQRVAVTVGQTTKLDAPS